MPLPHHIIEVLTVFRPLFTAPTWRKLTTLLTGTLLAQHPHGRSSPARQRQRPGNQLELLSSGAQPSAMVSLSGQSPAAPAHRRDLCASRSQRGFGD